MWETTRSRKRGKQTEGDRSVKRTVRMERDVNREMESSHCSSNYLSSSSGQNTPRTKAAPIFDLEDNLFCCCNVDNYVYVTCIVMSNGKCRQEQTITNKSFCLAKSVTMQTPLSLKQIKITDNKKNIKYKNH